MWNMIKNYLVDCLVEFLPKLVDRSRLEITVQKFFPEGYKIIFYRYTEGLPYENFVLILDELC